MNRAAGRIVLEVLLTVLVALALLAPWQWFLGNGTLLEGLGGAALLLFEFAEVGLAIWAILLVIFAVRCRPAGVGRTLLFAFIGAVANFVAVVVVAVIQGGWGLLLIVFGAEAGAAFLVAAAIVVPLVHRVILRSTASA